MKGIQLATMTIILIILGVIVFLFWVLFLGGSKGQIDVVMVREALRYCCSDRSVWDCSQLSISTTICKVPWGGGNATLEELASNASIPTSPIDQLCQFCNCGSCS